MPAEIRMKTLTGESCSPHLVCAPLPAPAHAFPGPVARWTVLPGTSLEEAIVLAHTRAVKRDERQGDVRAGLLCISEDRASR